jgi:uncharacterized protein
MSKVIQVSCPVCKTKVEWIPEQRFKPFCSERCKLIDLGDWATEAHKIPCDSFDLEASDDDSL